MSGKLCEWGSNVNDQMRGAGHGIFLREMGYAAFVAAARRILQRPFPTEPESSDRDRIRTFGRQGTG